jgi:hypothetical protein
VLSTLKRFGREIQVSGESAEHRHNDPGRPTRSGADRGKGLRLRASAPPSRCVSRTTIPRTSAGGYSCTRKVASATKCRCTTSSRSISTLPASVMTAESPLFRSATPFRSGELTNNPVHRNDAYRMVRWRAADAGVRIKIGCHTFRATGITAYLEAGGQAPRTPRSWRRTRAPARPSFTIRTGDEITLDEVERISV